MTQSIDIAKFKAISPDEQEHLIKEIEETASNMGQKFLGCSQWALYSLLKHLNLWNVDVFRVGSGFAGGVGGCGELCGALTGGLIVIGLIYGRDGLVHIDDSPEFVESMGRSAQLCDRFRDEFGSMRCQDVQKFLYGRKYTWNI